MKKILLLVTLAIAFVSFKATEAPQGLQVGDNAPLFNVIDQNGDSIHLKKLVATGNVVLLFYRGEWCPYCNKQLKVLQDSLALITAKGATVIAITPETNENVRKTIEKSGAAYSIVSDKNSEIMNVYKVAFELDDKTKERYKGYGLDLPKRNGTNGYYLPVPAVYIINREGKISYRFFDENYRKRPGVKELLNHL